MKQMKELQKTNPSMTFEVEIIRIALFAKYLGANSYV